MINLFKFTKHVMRQFTLMDMAIVKIDLVIVGLLLAKRFPVLISLHWGWYVGAIVIAEIYFIQRIRRMQ